MDFGLKTPHVNKVAELLKSQTEWFVRSFARGYGLSLALDDALDR